MMITMLMMIIMMIVNPIQNESESQEIQYYRKIYPEKL